MSRHIPMTDEQRAVIAALLHPEQQPATSELVVALAGAHRTVAEQQDELSSRPSRAEVLRAEARRLRRLEREMPAAGRARQGEGLLRAALVLDERADQADAEPGKVTGPTAGGITQGEAKRATEPTQSGGGAR